MDSSGFQKPYKTDTEVLKTIGSYRVKQLIITLIFAFFAKRQENRELQAEQPSFFVAAFFFVFNLDNSPREVVAVLPVLVALLVGHAGADIERVALVVYNKSAKLSGEPA